MTYGPQQKYGQIPAGLEYSKKSSKHSTLLVLKHILKQSFPCHKRHLRYNCIHINIYIYISHIIIPNGVERWTCWNNNNGKKKQIEQQFILLKQSLKFLFYHSENPGILTTWNHHSATVHLGGVHLQLQELHQSGTTQLSHHPGDTKWIPSGKHTKNYGKSPFLMGKLTINHHFQ